MSTTKQVAKLNRSFDYLSLHIYLITVTVVDREPVLSTVSGTVEEPRVELSEIGRAMIGKCFFFP